MNADDTIAAIASAAGGALRGIIRISGPTAVACLTDCFHAANQADLERLSRAQVIPGQFETPPFGRLPCDAYVWPDARSFTRQVAVELHMIGAPPILEAALARVCQGGARLAEPGEFTMRAFLAGRIDLTQAEAVLGVIDARGTRDLNVALTQMAGGLAGPLQVTRDALLDVLSHLEAGLDFVDEDIEFITREDLLDHLAAASRRVAEVAELLEQRGDSAGSIRVVLFGWPNVGKSSLLNALVDRSAAIVSNTPGTTRDYLVARMTVDGHPCELIDTAGIDTDATVGVEAVSQAVTKAQTEDAHLQLLCLDGSRDLNAWEQQALAESPNCERLVVLTKSDQPNVVRKLIAPREAIRTSSASGAGLDALRSAIARHVAQFAGGECGVVDGTASRCRESIRLASDSLHSARQLAEVDAGEEFVAAELRIALDELGSVAGVVYTDDILDRIFSRFCIGK